MLELITNNPAITGVATTIILAIIPLFLSEKKTKNFGATVAWLQFKFMFQRANAFNCSLKIIKVVFTTGFYFTEGYYLKMKELQGVRDKKAYLKKALENNLKK